MLLNIFDANHSSNLLVPISIKKKYEAWNIN